MWKSQQIGVNIYSNIVWICLHTNCKYAWSIVKISLHTKCKHPFKHKVNISPKIIYNDITYFVSMFSIMVFTCLQTLRKHIFKYGIINVFKHCTNRSSNIGKHVCKHGVNTSAHDSNILWTCFQTWWKHVWKQYVHMANIHQDGNSIRNIQLVSSNRVHSTHFCEANKCRIFKPFFLFIR